jgi:hypothetical protein
VVGGWWLVAGFDPISLAATQGDLAMTTLATEPVHAGGTLRRRWTFDRLLTALLFLALVVAAALTPIQNDTWWQLRAGHDMWSARRVLLTDTYSHTAYGAFWPNHEWLAEVIYYACYRVGGLALVTLAATASITAAWWISWRFTTGSTPARFALMAIALVPASMHWEPRPHAFSFLFLMTTLALLVTNRYMWLPVVFAVWANCHGGVLTGFLVLLVGLAVAVWKEPAGWRRRALAFAACAVAATMTPLGLSMWTELPKSLARIRLYPLDEWRRATLFEPRLAPFWIIAALLCIGSLRRWRSGHRRETAPLTMSALTLSACALALLPLAISAVRNVGLFLLVAVPAVTVLWQDRLQFARARRERPRLNLTIVSAAAGASALAIAWAYAAEIPRLRWTPLPPAAIAALQQCPGNLYNRYDEGGYLIWFAPEHRVFLDGRQDPYEPALILDQLRIETTGAYADTFARYQIRCAFLPTSSPVATRLVREVWNPLYRDANWLVLATNH